MTLTKLFGPCRATRSRIAAQAHLIVADATAPVICEALEARQLLTTYTYTVPTATPPHTAVYLQPTGTAGQVRVRLDSAGGTIDHTFTGNGTGTGMYIIDCGTNNPTGGFLFVDQVPAASKPTTDVNGHNGIKVQNGSHGTLRIEAAAADKTIRITECTSNSATVELKNTSSVVANSRLGTGVENLIIQTTSTGGSLVKVATDEPVGVPDLPGMSPDISLRIESLGFADQILLGGAENSLVNAVIRTGAGNNVIKMEQNHENLPPADNWTRAVIDFDPALGAALGSGNEVIIGEGNGRQCSATLANVTGTSHAMYVDLVTMGNGVDTSGAPAALSVEGSTTMGQLEIGPDITATVYAPLVVANSGSTSGALLLDGTIDFAGASNPSVIYTVQPFFLVEGEMNLLSGADVTLLTSSRFAALSIPDTTGKLTLQPRASSPSQPTARSLKINSLNMGTNPASPSGKVDLKDNAMIVDYTGTSPLSSIQSLTTSGYAAQAWTGNGINSSIAAAVWVGSDPHKTAVGYAEATVQFSTFPATFADHSVDSTSVLIKYTWYGDANLDGKVNTNDFTLLSANFNTTGKRWSQADFNFDTIVNTADFSLLAGNYGRPSLGDDDEGEGFSGGGGDEYYTEEELWKMLMDIIGG